MEQLEKKGAPASGENAGEAGKKPKPYFTVRVNKWLFAVALLIALVLLVRHFYLVVRVGIFLIALTVTMAFVFFISLQTATKPNNNVILNITLPREVHQEPGVLEIVGKFKKTCLLIFLASLAPVPALAFIRMPSMVILFMFAWFAAMFVAYNWAVKVYSGRLASLKREKGWLVGETHTVTVDLEVTKAKARMAVSRLWFLPSLAAAAFLLAYCLAYAKEFLALGITAVVAVMVYNFLYTLTVRERTRAYSEDAEVNMAVTRIAIKYWSLCWTVLAGVNVAVMATILIASRTYNEILGIVGVGGMILATLSGILVTHSKIQDTQNRLLTGDRTITVDEDYYWTGGLYNNPNDSRVLVPKRIGIGQTINLGTRTGRLVYFGTLIGVPVLLLGMFLLFLRLDTADFALTIQDNQVEIHAPLYGYKFPLNDIRSIAMVDTLPGGTRTNGASTSRYNLGNFNLKGYGRSKVYVYKNQPQYIVLELPDLYIFFSARSPEATQQYYELLINSMDKR